MVKDSGKRHLAVISTPLWADPVRDQPVPESYRYCIDPLVQIGLGEVISSLFGGDKLVGSPHLFVVLVIEGKLKMAWQISRLDDGCCK